jgi:hypothetical protein
LLAWASARRTPLGIEVGCVNRCARLLAPRLIVATRINDIESELVTSLGSQ